MSLVLLDKVGQMAKRRTMLRGWLLWKHNANVQRLKEVDAKYVAALQQRESDQVLQEEQSRAIVADARARVLRECEARESEEVAQYKRALLRQRERLLQMASAWSEQQAEHSVVSAETDEILRHEQRRAAETYMASKSKIDALESAMASQEMAVREAESKLRDVAGMALDCVLDEYCFCRYVCCACENMNLEKTIESYIFAFLASVK